MWGKLQKTEQEWPSPGKRGENVEKAEAEHGQLRKKVARQLFPLKIPKLHYT